MKFGNAAEQVYDCMKQRCGENLETERTQEELIVIFVFTFRQICVESEQTVNITKHIRNSSSQGTAIEIERPYQ